jgi:FkbM family methyltransferase
MGTRLRLLLIHNERLYRFSRRLLTIARYVLRRPHEPDFAAFSLYPERTGLFLDVGANAGQSALSFRLFNRTSPILSVEPNPYHEADLRFVKRILKRFDYIMCAAGDENTTMTLHVPSYKGVPLTGEASFVDTGEASCHWLKKHVHRDASPDLGSIDQSVPVRRLDDLELAPSFVKIDVEGFELPVLRGLRGTLERHRPILLLERSVGFEEVRGFLAELHYAPHTFDSRTRTFRSGTDDGRTNAFFIPSEDPSPATGSRPASAAPRQRADAPRSST